MTRRSPGPSFAQILGAALPDEALGEISSIEDGSIPDVPADANYAAAVYRLYRAGVLTGNDRKGTFTPFQPITRGAAAAIVGRMLVPGQRIAITLVQAPFEPVPVTKLANLKSLRKKTTDAEFRQAYDAAVELVTPLGKLSREEQLYGIAVALRDMVESGQVAYSMSAAHYNDPYGYFVAGVSSCAGCTRATGLCLNILGIPYEHVNENQYAHQWCRVKMPDGSYWDLRRLRSLCGAGAGALPASLFLAGKNARPRPFFRGRAFCIMSAAGGCRALRRGRAKRPLPLSIAGKISPG